WLLALHLHIQESTDISGNNSLIQPIHCLHQFFLQGYPLLLCIHPQRQQLFFLVTYHDAFFHFVHPFLVLSGVYIPPMVMVLHCPFTLGASANVPCSLGNSAICSFCRISRAAGT